LAQLGRRPPKLDRVCLRHSNPNDGFRFTFRAARRSETFASRLGALKPLAALAEYSTIRHEKNPLIAGDDFVMNIKLMHGKLGMKSAIQS
jgi:hypothetical protein